MNFEHAREVVVNLLCQQGRAKNSELLAAVGGDEALFKLVCLNPSIPITPARDYEAIPASVSVLERLGQATLDRQCGLHAGGAVPSQ
jgi:hypothetical protein